MGKSSVDMERLSDSIVCARGFTVEKAIDVAWLLAQVDRTCSSTISLVSYSVSVASLDV